MNRMLSEFSKSKDLTRRWLQLALLTLVMGMVFAVLLLLLRTPWLVQILPVRDWFSWVLVLHVDLSIVGWYCAFAGFFISLLLPESGVSIGRFAYRGSVLGVLFMLLAVLDNSAQPMLNNYFPVIDSTIFYIGLSTLLLSTLLSFLRLLQNIAFAGRLVEWVLLAALWVGVVALITTVIAWFSMPTYTHGDYYFELLFWGGGHLFQAMYTLIMCAAWLWLSGEGGSQLPSSSGVVIKLLVAVVALGATATLSTSYFGVDTYVYRHSYTLFMMYVSWLPVPVVACRVIHSAFDSYDTGDGAGVFVVVSAVLFFIGLFVGALIRDDSLIVPAHYHATTAGINLAFFAVIYRQLLGREAFRPLVARVLAYFFGVLLLVVGLGWGGMQRIPRKVAGLQQWESLPQQLSLALVVVGGGVALVAIFSILGYFFRFLGKSGGFTVSVTQKITEC